MSYLSARRSVSMNMWFKLKTSCGIACRRSISNCRFRSASESWQFNQWPRKKEEGGVTMHDDVTMTSSSYHRRFLCLWVASPRRRAARDAPLRSPHRSTASPNPATSSSRNDPMRHQSWLLICLSHTSESNIFFAFSYAICSGIELVLRKNR